MKKYFLLILSLIFTSQVMAQEEMEVRLATENPFVPIYLTRLHKDYPSFDGSYLDKIRAVLNNDMRHIAKAQVLNVDPKIEDIFLSPDKELDASFWKKQSLVHLFFARVQKNQLVVTTFSETHKIPQVFSSYLSGDLSVDRKKIHEIVSKIAKKIFDVDGIFFHRLLFTKRNEYKNKEGLKETSEVWISDYDGANAKQITTRESGYAVHPLFLPGKIGDGKRSFLFVSYKFGVPKIYRSFLDRPSQMDPAVTLRGNQLIPTFCEEKGLISFISDAAGRPDLFIQEFDPILGERNMPVQLFSMPRATQASPAFSPDGEKITFVSDKDGTPRIYLMKIPDNLSMQKRPFVHLVTKKNRQNVTPSWSADGTKLAYSAKTEGIRQIWIYDFITDEEWQLTKGPQNKENPTWAPDSVHIVYNTEENDRAELYMISIHHKREEKMNLGSGKKRFPSWEIGSK